MREPGFHQPAAAIQGVRKAMQPLGSPEVDFTAAGPRPSLLRKCAVLV